MPHTYVTTTIPYVNARPHLGFALELVQADVLARHRRQAGDAVRLQTGTDDNSLNNVLAAEAAGVGVREFVDGNAAAFDALAGPLELSADDVIHTGRDPRHRPGVERFWQACAASGDLYRAHYDGLYCVGCEQFYTENELVGGRCPDHRTVPRPVSEENWFFRLSRYAERLYALIAAGTPRIEPASRRNEVLAFIAAGLSDFSISRSTARARGWGIPVPGDPDQVIYVWWDALGNYLTALGYGTGAGEYARWWTGADRRVHVVGKGVLRFHAVYWPAMLLSAGEPLPTEIFVHDYLTVDGHKISKSAGVTVDPAEVIRRYGTDAVRWWLLREVPRHGDADFTEERLAARSDDELANGLGNLVNRTIAMIHRYQDGREPEPRTTAPGAAGLDAAVRAAPAEIESALAAFDFRRATGAVQAVVDAANRYVNQSRPWDLARAEGGGAELDAILAKLLATCRDLAVRLTPFLPGAAARITRQCTPANGRLPVPSPIFDRLG